MNIQTPKYGNWLTFGNVLTIMFGVISATGMFFIMDARTQSNERYIVEIRSDVSKVEEDVRVLQTDSARSEEKYIAIFNLLNRIDSKIERLERQR